MQFILGLLIGIVAGLAAYYLFQKKLFNKQIEEAEAKKKELENKAQEIIKEAELKAKEIVLEGKKEIDKERRKLNRELKEKENLLNKRDQQLTEKEGILIGKEKELKDVERKLKDREHSLNSKESEIKEKEAGILKELERISGLTQEEAKEHLVQMIEDEAKHIAAKRLKIIEETYLEQQEKIAKKIIATAVQRYAGEYVTENTVTTVSLPNEEMKGRIIGREGRNIRAIEAVTGSELIIDDTPEAVVISDFNPVRREITRLTLEKLITDGRIHPARIEEVFNIASKEVWKTIKEAGEQAIFDLGIHKMHPELLLLIGRLKYRTSYGQNVWKHSMEVAFIAGMLASELGVSVKLAKRAGLLHDIGKAVDHEVEGSHATIGADLAQKYGESKAVVHAIAAHHGDVPTESLLDLIIQAADAISGARPGARREIMDSYIQRLTELEKVATSFDGVEKAFAIQAGRELRVLVNTEEISDEKAGFLAHEIAKKIEEELTYPGQIKVVVIRETRVIAMAQ